MLTPRKALTEKKKIKEDKFVTSLFSTWDRVKGYSRNILYGVGAVAVVVLVIVMVRQSGESSRREAKQRISRADLALENNRNDEALAAYQEVVDNYGKNDITARACLAVANIHFFQGNLAEAEKYYTQVLDRYSHEDLEPAAAAGLAACLENKKDYQGAAAAYEKCARDYKSSYLAPECLMGAARCYREVKDYPSAERCYTLISTAYEKSDYAREAGNQLKMVKALAQN
jgi:TolA-binding protein